MKKFSVLRANERAFDVLRPCNISLNPMGFALSSLMIRAGNTSVLCSVCFQKGVPAWREGSGKGWLSAEYRLLPASTPNRQKRELLTLSGRTQEIQRLISRSLRAVIDMNLLGENTLLVDCDVVQADAGTRTTSITGAWVAVQLACQRLTKEGLIGENPIKGQVAAVSVGLKDGVPLLDLDYSEDSSVDVDLNVVMDSSFRLLEIQGTAEKEPFSKQELNNMLELAERGITQLLDVQLSELGGQE